MNTKTDTKTKAKPETSPISILKTATAKKLNPKLDGELEYQIALIDDALHLRISSNSSGGFFSKEWLSLEKIEQYFNDNVKIDTDFKSNLLKPLFEQGHSSNNTGFLCACLRAELLLSISSKNVFLHQFTGDFTAWNKTLNLLAKT
ncbi:hypothetical protein A3Q34_07855 [Colwellia sp. PAMC 20917]|jgi:hypothetical protein|uniref:hypothetical protein n=1 Tax=Colwellia sp. PAMC 20917 TaxID=1816218 RepID=UPI000878A765|nr:hypothetical protein [Colwellia sp. PAMC 20917]AOW76772.1 hypothetical protein A3Q34_07855 [Colwellia sp. PAMC 20917]